MQNDTVSLKEDRLCQKTYFFRLPSEKQQKILSVLETEFKIKPFPKVNVKEIFEKSGIARGSFYQYFEDLEDAYFTILEKETVDIHRALEEYER